ncbi:MurR/RpiR family transcriptional regulator [Natronospirillum operosum]|uniref:MurR/RpiR family transcriptional regulator n=1 Tax=Natronospirillum operosum TaxID=2759953 RepID=A0A4Z0WEL7_9GAMM|nr:MurR/RpiR family transcriptional regulator [Natronospirillum operosum]TGG93902.1 MurR/RpiR family transcriptional regulator [Natronospirillum operosum]
MDIISRIRDVHDSLSRAERQVADYILDNLDVAVRTSTTDLARAANVSPPTITRFCRSIGCDSLKSVKLELAQAQVVGGRYLRKPYHQGDVRAVQDNVIGGLRNAIHQLENQLDQTALEAAVGRLKEARRVVVFGGGGSGANLAEELENRLFRLGLHASAYVDTQMQTMVAATLSQGDVLVILSATGRFEPLVKCAEIARQYQAEVIALTRPGSALARSVDVALTLSIEESEDILKPTASRYAFMALLDILATAVAVEMELVAAERLRRIKYQLIASRDGVDDGQPLGD